MNGNFHLMALTGIGSLKHHVLSTKRAGFIFIFIVQTIKSGVEVKQKPFDMMLFSEKQHQIWSVRLGLMRSVTPLTGTLLAHAKDERCRKYCV